MPVLARPLNQPILISVLTRVHTKPPEDTLPYQERIELCNEVYNAQATFCFEANRVLANLRRTADPVARNLTSTHGG